ncbi:MAG TPA: biotin--[acetyl-CoA-carboxylase] ligase [Marinobacter sp.]|nr:biotin--[acetyl-CoA-carboxylase] ligase [Marinobacter sp.]
MMTSNKLLTLLSDGAVHSGESLAKTLGVSRTAVWKQVRKLVADGVLEVKSIKGQGYQLVGSIDLLDRSAVFARLPDEIRAGISLEVLPEVVSTNLEVARRLPGSGSTAPVVIADYQSGGRGRRGRDWQSPRGQNLYLSMGLTLTGGFAALEGLSLVLGVAVSRALERLGADTVGLKWPNDLFANGHKFGGILVEIQGELQEGVVQVIAGIGINVHMTDVEGVDQPWTALTAAWPATAWTRNDIAARVIEETFRALELFQSEGFAPFGEAWQSRDIFFGKELISRGGQLSGTGAGVDPGGNYLLETGSGPVPVTAGDISLRVRS